MTQEEKQQIANLEGQLNQLRTDFETFKNKPIEKPGNIFEDIKFFNSLKTNQLIIRFISQATEPVIQANEIVLWQDTDDSKTYIVANFNGTTNHIELV